MNQVEEAMRAINATIAYHKRKIVALEDAKKAIMDKYNIPYDNEDGDVEND